MAVVRYFALNLVQAAKDKHSIRLRRKLATWTLADLEHLLNADTKQLGSEALGYSLGCTLAAPGSKPGFMKTSPVGGC